jgi:hypothetical protein
MKALDHEVIKHNDFDDKQIKVWRTVSLKILLYSHYDTEKELRNDWDAFQGMKIQNRRESDWKSLDLFGLNNTDRYNKMLSEFLKNDIEDSLYDNYYGPEKGVMRESTFERADEWNSQNTEKIITKADSLDDLEKQWDDFNGITIDHQKKLNDVSNTIFGMDNVQHYRLQKSKFLKDDIDDSLDIDTISMREEALAKYASNIDPVYAAATCTKILESNAMIHEALKETFETPKEFYQYLVDNKFGYGFIGSNNKKYTGITSGNIKYYRVSKPEDTFKNKIGICVDYAIMQKAVFDNMHIKNKIFTIIQDNENNTGHSFSIIVINDKYYWFEYSYDKYKGINGPYKSCENAIDYIHALLNKSNADNGYYFVDMSNSNLYNLTMKSYMELAAKSKRNKIQESTNSYKYYFISEKYMDGKTLEPRIPSNFLTKNGYEDSKTKRVCFSTSIDGCLTALSQNCKGKEYYIHTPDGEYQVYKPTAQEVPDCKITKEVWVKEPVKIKCIAKIKVTDDDKNPGKKYTYGDGKSAELYGWKWKYTKDSSNVITKTIYESTEKNIKDKIDVDNLMMLSITPFYTPYEMEKLGISTLDTGMYSNDPDNTSIGVITTKDWFLEYKNKFNGYNGDYTEASTWVETMKKLYSDYNEIKESGNIDTINNRKQSILDLGWNPEIEFNEANRTFASNRVNSIIKEQYSNYTLIDVEESVSLMDESYSTDTYINALKDVGLRPIFIVFFNTKSVFNKLVRAIDKSVYSHVAISFSPSLKTMYSFDPRHHGFTTEGLSKYVQNEKVKAIQVFCAFIDEDKFHRMQSKVSQYSRNKNNYDYSFLNILTIPFKINYIDNAKMVCSQFVDSMLKLADLDFTKLGSNLISPGKINRALKRHTGVMYKIYTGPPNKYSENKIADFINKLANQVAKTESNILRPFLSIIPIKEAKEFPIQFSDDGDLLISKGKDIDFEGEYSRCHMALLEYDKANNAEGMKYCLCKLWYMNIILEEKIHDEKNKENLKKHHKARAKILNDIKTYMKKVQKLDKDFDILKEYNDSPFNDKAIKIRRSTLLYTIDLFKRIIGIKA